MAVLQDTDAGESEVIFHRVRWLDQGESSRDLQRRQYRRRLAAIAQSKERFQTTMWNGALSIRSKSWFRLRSICRTRP